MGIQELEDRSLARLDLESMQPADQEARAGQFVVLDGWQLETLDNPLFAEQRKKLRDLLAAAVDSGRVSQRTDPG
jgi:hypothetical protein